MTTAQGKDRLEEGEAALAFENPITRSTDEQQTPTVGPGRNALKRRAESAMKEIDDIRVFVATDVVGNSEITLLLNEILLDLTRYVPDPALIFSAFESLVVSHASPRPHMYWHPGTFGNFLLVPCSSPNLTPLICVPPVVPVPVLRFPGNGQAGHASHDGGGGGVLPRGQW